MSSKACIVISFLVEFRHLSRKNDSRKDEDSVEGFITHMAPYLTGCHLNLISVQYRKGV